MSREGKDTAKRNVVFEKAKSYPRYEYQRLEHGSGVVLGCNGESIRKVKKIPALGELDVASLRRDER